MTNFRTFIPALAVALTMVSAPAFAKSQASHAGHAARAQAIEQVIDDGSGLSPDRARALRECNEVANVIKTYTLVTSQFAIYRSCMAQHGQQE